MESGSAAKIQIAGLFRPEAIELNLQAADEEAVLRELIEKLPELKGRPDDQERLLKALWERERLCSTGIGDGVALPHVRNPLPDTITKPVIVFGRHSEGVEFGAIDGKPVQLFFLIASTDTAVHLYVLAKLSRLLRRPEVREALLKARTPAAVLEIISDAEAHLS